MNSTLVKPDAVVQFFQWMEKTAKTIGIKIAVHREFRAHWPEVAAARAYFSFRGQRVEGMGFGQTDEQAIMVAVAELVERTCLLASTESISSSNGFAVHTNPQLAERNALFELLERDAYLCHHLTETPFLSYSEDQLARINAPSWRRLVHMAESSGLRLKLGAMRTMSAGRGFILALDGHKFSPAFGTIVSLAYDSSQEIAIERCARSAMASLVYRICSDVWQSLSLADFRCLPDPTPEDHGQYALYADKQEWLQKAFVTNEHSTIDKTSPQVGFHAVRIPEELENPPLYACRAISKDVQNLFFGWPKVEDINLKRLEDFSGRRISLAEVLQIKPHLLD